MSAEAGTRAFAPFEWMVALRYLRARRKEGFISVIAGFSFIGIMLGVATLIIVMAVMNGFRQELFNKMLGLNGHVVVHSLTYFNDYDDVAARIRAVQGVKFALPLVEGQVMVSTPSTSSGALVRGLREADLKQLKAIADNIRFGTLDGFDKQARACDWQPTRQRAQCEGWRPGLAADPARRLDRARHGAEGEALSRGRDLRDRHVRI